jgi:homoserine dehydrogenase
VIRSGLIVLKFGSSVLRTEEDLPLVVDEIARWLKSGDRVVTVVSAFGNTTEKLFERGRKYGDASNEQALAALVATGEEVSAALLVLALGKGRISASLLDAAQIWLIAEGSPVDARLCGVSVERISRSLAECDVVVVPGFIARTATGTTALLGRGGSDLTALFLAARLGASRCRLVKYVDGLYALDPNGHDAARPERYKRIGWDGALRLGGGVVQQKALHFAAENKLTFEVGGIGRDYGTVVGEGSA